MRLIFKKGGLSSDVLVQISKRLELFQGSRKNLAGSCSPRLNTQSLAWAWKIELVLALRFRLMSLSFVLSFLKAYFTSPQPKTSTLLPKFELRAVTSISSPVLFRFHLSISFKFRKKCFFISFKGAATWKNKVEIFFFSFSWTLANQPI